MSRISLSRIFDYFSPTARRSRQSKGLRRVTSTDGPADEIDPRATNSGIIFISYAREDKSFAVRVAGYLEGQGRNVWLDVRILHGAEWEEEILEKLTQSVAVIFIVSGSSIAADSFCTRELQVAVNHHKRIIPILLEAVDPATLPPAVGRLHYLDFSGNPTFDDGSELLATLDRDFDHIRQHSYIASQQVEWLNANQDPDLLLKGEKLLIAVRWLENVTAEQRPTPTQAHRDFVRESSSADLRRKRKTRVVFAIVAAGLIGGGFLTKGLYDYRRKERVTRLVQKSSHYLKSDPELSLSLALEAVNLAKTKETEDALRLALIYAPGRLTLSGHTDAVNGGGFDPTGKLVTTASDDKSVRIWSADDGELKKVLYDEAGVLSAEFNPIDSKYLLTLNRAGKAAVWDWGSGIKRLDPQLSGCSISVLRTTFSPDGRYVIFMGGKQICAWKKNGDEFEKVNTFNVTGTDDFTAMEIGGESKDAATPPKSFLAASESAGKITIWNLETASVVWSIDAGVPSTSLTFDPNATLLVSAGTDNLARIWDMRTRLLDSEIQGPISPLTRHSFTPDGEQLVIPRGDSATLIFQRAVFIGGQRIMGKGWGVSATLKGTEGNAHIAYFSDNKQVVTVGRDHSIGVWTISLDSPEGKTYDVLKLRAHINDIAGIVQDSTGRRMISFGGDTAVRLWQIRENGRYQVREWPLTIKGGVSCLRFSPDKKLAVIGGSDGRIVVWTLFSSEWYEQPIYLDSGIRNPVLNAAISPDNSLVLTANGNDGSARLFARQSLTETKQEFNIFKQHDEQFPLPRDLPTLSMSKTELERRIEMLMASYKYGPPIVEDAQFSPDGKMIAIASPYLTQLFAVGAEKGENLLGDVGSAHVQFHPDGERIIADIRSVNSQNGKIAIVNFQSHSVNYFEGHSNNILDLAISTDGKYLVSASVDGTARIWDLDGYRSLFELRHFEDAEAPDLSEKEKIKARTDHEVTTAEFSPDTNLVATASIDGAARLWQRTTGKLLFSLTGHVGPVRSIRFSPDGKLLVTAGADGTARVWSVETGASVVILNDAKEPLKGAVFTPDGLNVITFGSEDYIRIYSQITFAPLEELIKIGQTRQMLDGSDPILQKERL